MVGTELPPALAAQDRRAKESWRRSAAIVKAIHLYAAVLLAELGGEVDVEEGDGLSRNFRGHLAFNGTRR